MFYQRILGEGRRSSGLPPGFDFTLNERGEYFSITERPANRAVGIDHVCFSIEDYDPVPLRRQLESLAIIVEETGDPDQVFLRDRFFGISTAYACN